MIDPHHRSADQGLMRHPDTVACYSTGCPEATTVCGPCRRAQLARSRRPQPGDLTGHPDACQHYVPGEVTADDIAAKIRAQSVTELERAHRIAHAEGDLRMRR